jgi:HAE1 family hydrophobic/amphiphilic exporter-1
MNIAMFPDMSQDTVSVSVELPQGSKYEDTRAIILQLQAIAIEEIKGAESIIVNVGSSGMAFLASQSTNAGELSIKMKANDKDADSSMEVQEKMRTHFVDFPTATIQFSEGMAAMLSGVDINMSLRVDDIDMGFREAQKIKDLLGRHIPDLTDITIDLNEGLPQVEVVIDRGRAYDMGLNVAGIAAEIAASMNGVTATTFRQAGNEYSVILQLAEEDRTKLPDLERIFVSSNTGRLVPLSNFAALEKGMGPVAISRENQSRIIHITANIEGSKRADEVENNIRSMLSEQYLLPEGITIGYEGQWQSVTEMLLTFVLVISLAILLVFGVMAAQYESFKNPAINLCTIPLMLIGVILIYLISGEAMTAMTMVGLVMLAGIVVNNGIILVDYTNLLVGRGLPVKEACLAAGESRLRPVLMTTLTTILGLVPMAFFPGEAAMLTQSIGLTVIGGLTSSTVITLLFIPVLYSLFNKDKPKIQKG